MSTAGGTVIDMTSAGSRGGPGEVSKVMVSSSCAGDCFFLNIYMTADLFFSLLNVGVVFKLSLVCRLLLVLFCFFAVR